MNKSYLVWLVVNYIFIELVQRCFERLAVIKEASNLKDGLALFMQHYLRNFDVGIGTGNCSTYLVQT